MYSIEETAFPYSVTLKTVWMFSFSPLTDVLCELFRVKKCKWGKSWLPSSFSFHTKNKYLPKYEFLLIPTLNCSIFRTFQISKHCQNDHLDMYLLHINPCTITVFILEAWPETPTEMHGIVIWKYSNLYLPSEALPMSFDFSTYTKPFAISKHLKRTVSTSKNHHQNEKNMSSSVFLGP